MNYKGSNHSFFCLKSHIIISTKYRKSIIKNRLKASLGSIIDNMNYDFQVESYESDLNHLHMLVDYPPKLSITSIVRTIKQITTFNLWNLHKNYLSFIYWKENTFWSDGYFCCSTGGVSIEVVKKYIENQGRNSSPRLKT